MMKVFFRASSLALATLIVTACGGGGGEVDTETADPASYWTMDSYHYINGGYSAVSTSTVTGTPVTAAVISTATLGGGDNSNGAYSGSSLSFTFKGSSPTGVYTIVADRTAFLAADISAAPILVEITVGVAKNSGATQYVASAGSIYVERTGTDKYHFSSTAAIPTVKAIDVQGGVTGAPTSMALTITDAH